MGRGLKVRERGFGDVGAHVLPAVGSSPAAVLDHGEIGARLPRPDKSRKEAHRQFAAWITLPHPGIRVRMTNVTRMRMGPSLIKRRTAGEQRLPPAAGDERQKGKAWKGRVARRG